MPRASERQIAVVSSRSQNLMAARQTLGKGVNVREDAKIAQFVVTDVYVKSR